jgi:hypothetical protein
LTATRAWELSFEATAAFRRMRRRQSVIRIPFFARPILHEVHPTPNRLEVYAFLPIRDKITLAPYFLGLLNGY